MAKQKAIKNEEKAIIEIVRKYGDTINLKKSPYLIAEIIREYAPYFIPNEEGSEPTPGSHGTPPPPPPPGPDNIFDARRKFAELSSKVSKLAARLKQLETKINI